MEAIIKFLLDSKGADAMPWVIMLLVVPAQWWLGVRREKEWRVREDKRQEQLMSLQRDSITGLEAARTAIVSTQNAVTAFKDLYIATSKTGQDK